ncbi:alkene reductase [Gracilimonas sp.]|uniref:alkene reductase n=1 Tax=Gracilimonas sp. TaxID=1974203 RepID=UPI0032EF116A
MLFNDLKLGNHLLKNRIVMPPMTRSRAGHGDVPTSLMAKYYQQRTSAGLIISEGTQISQQGKGYAWTPGIHSPEQVKGWKEVTDAVRKKDGVIFAQLWHVGRVSHTSLQPANKAPVSSSELVADGVKVYIDPENKGPESGAGEMIQHSKPSALSFEGINNIIHDFKKAAKNAKEAGFDGVEIHAANGYLINQFIDSQANNRKDKYGGSVHNRLRFLKEVTQTVCKVFEPDHVGVRLAPLTTLQGCIDDNPRETYIEAAKILESIGIGYIHIAEADWDDAPEMTLEFRNAFRNTFSGKMIYAGKYNLKKAVKAIHDGWADMIGFGRPFIANPDLPTRLKYGIALNKGNPDTYFGGTEIGYTDYSNANLKQKEK